MPLLKRISCVIQRRVAHTLQLEKPGHQLQLLSPQATAGESMCHKVPYEAMKILRAAIKTQRSQINNKYFF